MYAQSLIQVRVDRPLKDDVSGIFEMLGMDISTAIRMFLKKCRMERGIPFAMTVPDEVLARQEAKRAMQELRQASEGDLSMDEIDAEIAAARKDRRANRRVSR